jgi:anti-sigma regulatory factor (Ser/Thr protein kinase)
MNKISSIRIESKYTELNKLRNFIQQNLSNSKLSGKEIHILELVTFEASANSIEHGYGNKPGNHIDVILKITDKTVNIIILDDGKEIDYKSLPKLSINDIINKGSKRGLGIPLINELMDKVEFSKTSEGRNKLLLTKDFSSSKVED